jgi:hypothetical protein
MLNFLAGRFGRVWHQPPAKRPAAEQEELLHQAFQLYTGQSNGRTHFEQGVNMGIFCLLIQKG